MIDLDVLELGSLIAFFDEGLLFWPLEEDFLLPAPLVFLVKGAEVVLLVTTTPEVEK